MKNKITAEQLEELMDLAMDLVKAKNPKQSEYGHPNYHTVCGAEDFCVELNLLLGNG